MARGIKNKKIEATEAQAVLTTVKGMSLPKVVAEVSDLQLTIQGQLANLSSSLASKIQQVEQLDTAISLKEQRLKELYAIESEATTIDDMKAAKAEETANWDKEREDRTVKWNLESTERTQKWQREFEEYNYVWGQKKARQQEEFDAEVARNKRNETIRQEALAKTWTERENAIKAKETEYAELKKQVEGFDARLHVEVAKAEQILANTMKKQYEHESTLLRKDCEANQKLADMRVASAENKVAALTDQINQLQVQLASARADAKEVASQALQSASGRQVADALQRVVDTRDNSPTGKK